MKLYRTTLKHSGSGNRIFETRFNKSFGAAKKAIALSDNAMISVHVCNLQSNLAASDWIDLLEGDAPGDQEQVKTAVDFLEVGECVWTKNGKEVK